MLFLFNGVINDTPEKGLVSFLLFGVFTTKDLRVWVGFFGFEVAIHKTDIRLFVSMAAYNRVVSLAG